MALPDLNDCTIAELLQGLNRGLFTSTQLVNAYLARTAQVSDQLHPVVEINDVAVKQAATRDAQRRQHPHAQLPLLHGIPIFIKDIIATASPSSEEDEKLNTSAGSLALLGAFPSRDAPVVARLRESGAIILGKTNTSEWAHFRSLHPAFPPGWSARGGQTTNPYFPSGDPGGSSAGSAVAAAVGLAPATLGTETHGSISCPSSMCGVVGLKPTVELVSREGVIPISKTQDSVGPICANVSDVARVLQAIATPPPPSLPPVTLTLQDPDSDYLSALSATFISENKIRIGIPRAIFCTSEALGAEHKVIMETFERTVEVLRSLGGVTVDPADIPTTPQVFERGESPPEEWRIMCAEFKDGINRYLAGLGDVPSGVRTLKDLIAFNEQHVKEELPPGWTDIDASNTAFIEAEKTPMDEKYHEALEWCRSMARDQGIDAALQEYCVDVLAIPCSSRGWTYPCMAGYPSLTMPIGFFPESTPPQYALGEEYPHAYPAPGMPFAISFLGTAWSERMLIGCAFALECELRKRGLDRMQTVYDQARPKTQLKDVINNGS